MREPWEITEEMFLSEEEVTCLLDWLAVETADGATTAVVDRVIVEGLLFSGLRTTEFCRLRVRDTIVGHGESAFRVEERAREPRTVFVPAVVSERITAFVRDVRPGLLKGGDPDDVDGPLVPNTRGKPYERTSLYRRVVRVLSAAGLGDRASVQLLRHTYGFLAYKRSGGNLLFVQRQLGHAHPMVTAVYARFADESYSALADRVAGDVPNERSPKRRRR